MVAGAKLRGGELTGVGGSGTTEGHLGCCLVQKNVHAMRNPLECTGWRFWAQPWLAMARGGPGHRQTARTQFQPHFGRDFMRVSTSVARHSFLGTQVGLRHSGQDRRHGAAAQLNYGEENPA